MNQKILFEIKKFRGNPCCVLFSDRKKISDLEKTIADLPKNSAIIIREYDLNQQEREIFAKKIIGLVRQKRISQRPRILIGKDFLLAKKLKVDGLHFSDFDKSFVSFLERKLPKKFILSLSCHSPKSLLKVSDAKLNMIFISPVFPTTSHFGTRVFGLRNLAKFSSQHRSKKYFLSRIYGLGGVNSFNLKSIRKLGIGGFGAIDLFQKRAQELKNI